MIDPYMGTLPAYRPYIRRAQRLRAQKALRFLRGLGEALISPLRRIVAHVNCTRAKRRAMSELRSLDDRMLKDIGVPRGEILSVAKAAARGECGENHATDLPLNLHKSAMMQRSHSGLRALHT